MAWYRVELVGGPLHGEVSCLSHTSHRLWVALLENGAHVVLRSLARPDTLPGAGTLIGDYSFDPAHEAMRWVANPPDVEIASAK